MGCSHYEQLAPIYDRKWRRYNERTLTAALDTLALSSAGRLLDIGCGTGELERLALRRFPRLEMTGLDVTSTMVAVAKEKLAGCPAVTFIMGHAEALPFGEGRFDAVVSANMLHHVRQPRDMLRECVRVLRPGGQLVVVDWCVDVWPSRLLDWWSRLTDRTYVRMYRVRELRSLLEGVGVTVTQTRRFLAPPCYGMMCVSALNQ